MTSLIPAALGNTRAVALLSEQLNSSNDTYAKQDLFDVLYKIGRLKDDGLTQQAMADTIGWSRQQLSNYAMLSGSIATQFLKSAMLHQEGRVAEIATPVATSDKTQTYYFTEGWFRTSGLYDLNEEFQMLFFDKFKADNFNWNKAKVQQMTAKWLSTTLYECVTLNRQTRAAGVAFR